MTALPPPEYPRPQYRRDRWLNLNGLWEFAEVTSATSKDDWLGRDLPGTIMVPFCRESPLSGLQRTGHVAKVWYARSITIPDDWHGQRILLHFGAADYITTVWIDSNRIGTHRGGHSSFSFDITANIRAGTSHRLTVRCEDDPKLPRPCGKQRSHPDSSGCHYIHTTGIWQTVWLEPVPMTWLGRPRITPNVDAGGFWIEQRINHPIGRYHLGARLAADGNVICEATVAVANDFSASLWLPIPPEERRLWVPSAPFLYDLTLTLKDADETAIDVVESYAGLRSVAIRGDRVLINGQSHFQRLVLDQGYYPDGLLTAPNDAALLGDIQIGLEHGFNGARFHQKIFEERALYHADRLGYLAWAELPDWGPEFQKDEPKTINARWIEEWLEAVERDYSHPCIIGWCPLNEQEAQNPRHLAELETVQRSLVLATRLADRTRPVLDASGWIHRCPESDIYDDHSYEQDPVRLAGRYTSHADFSQTRRGAQDNLPSAGRPFLLSEFGGASWIIDADGTDADAGAWGYGTGPRTVEEYLDRFTGLCRALLDNPHCFGYCFTQLTDVFQEKNGLCTFARARKFDPALIRAAQSTRAAIEAPA